MPISLPIHVFKQRLFNSKQFFPLFQVVETVVCKPEPPESPPKKVRGEEYSYALFLDQYALHYRAISAFRPWGKREPVLQNPERVVRVANCTEFERDYQPNVALKPLTPPVDDVTSSTSPPPQCDSELAARLLDVEARLVERARRLDEREAELVMREARVAAREAELALLEPPPALLPPDPPCWPTRVITRFRSDERLCYCWRYTRSDAHGWSRSVIMKTVPRTPSLWVLYSFTQFYRMRWKLTYIIISSTVMEIGFVQYTFFFLL